MKTPVEKNCVKCGLCLSVCPVYKAFSQEEASPRARIQLIKFYKKGMLESSENLKEMISKCLMCGSCAAHCPSGIDHYDQFMEMRTRMSEDHGDPASVKSLVFLLAREYRIRMAAGLARVGQRLLPQKFAQHYNLGNIPVKRLPKFNAKPFRHSVPGITQPAGKKKGTVLYFTGCATNYLFDRTGFSTLDVLTRMGYEVIVPEDQTCCGIPLLYHGAVKQARENVKTNIRGLDLKGVTAVIVDCPTCGSALKNEYPALVDRFGLDEETVANISSKVIDIMTFFYLNDGEEILTGREPEIAATHHLPCHMKNGLSGMNHTGAVLKALPFVDYRQASDADACCGGGGTFFQEFPDISKIMVDQKIKNALKTKADAWLTECPVCRINLSGNLTDDDPIQVKHPVELLSRAKRSEI